MFEFNRYMIYKLIFIVAFTWLIMWLNISIIIGVGVALGLNEVYDRVSGRWYYGKSPRV